MRRGFTLLELVIVLTLLSLLLTLLFPFIVKSDLNSNSSLKIKVSSLFSSAFTPGSSEEVCINFKKNSLKVGEERVKFPWKIESLVLPGRVVSSESVTRYCFDLKGLTYGAIISENGGKYPSILFTFPAGETLFYNLSQSEANTLKDKVGKGRIVEWFSYYSY